MRENWQNLSKGPLIAFKKERSRQLLHLIAG